MTDPINPEGTHDHALALFVLGLALGATGAYLVGTAEGRRLSLDFIDSLPPSDFKSTLLSYFHRISEHLSTVHHAPAHSESKSIPPLPGYDFPPPPPSIPKNPHPLDSIDY